MSCGHGPKTLREGDGALARRSWKNAFERKVYRIYTFRKSRLYVEAYRAATRVSCGHGPKTLREGDGALARRSWKNAFERKVYRIHTFRKSRLYVEAYRTATRVSCGHEPTTRWDGAKEGSWPESLRPLFPMYPFFTRPPSYTFLLCFRGRRTRGRIRVSLARRARSPEGR